LGLLLRAPNFGTEGGILFVRFFSFVTSQVSGSYFVVELLAREASLQ
jgi:hypothetical protein